MGRPCRWEATKPASSDGSCSPRWCPSKNEEDAYNEALRKSIFPDPQNDYPKYGGYKVERLEVPGASESADLDWTKATKLYYSGDERVKVMARWRRR